MLENVHHINWKNLGDHVYGKHDRIPAAIAQLVAQDADVRETAREFLLGGGQDFGAIYDTTPHIIPFLIELLTDAGTPDKAQLLDHLSSVLEHTFLPYYTSVHAKRLCLAIYSAFSARLPIFINLLMHDSVHIRLTSVDLLQFMADDVEMLVPVLMTQFGRERNEEVRIALLRALKTLLGSLDWFRSHLRDEYVPFFKKILSTDPHNSMRVAAARAAVELVGQHEWRYEKLFPEIPALLAQEFLVLSTPLTRTERNHADYHMERVAQDIGRLDPHQFLDVLRDPALSSKHAHLLTRSLLARAFSVDHPSHWDHMLDMGQLAKGMFYVQYPNRSSPKILPGTMSILEAIVGADAVWQVPTNLFSFFYNLPDSREALQALLVEEGRKPLWSADIPGF